MQHRKRIKDYGFISSMIYRLPREVDPIRWTT